MYLCDEQITIYNRFTNANKEKEYLPTLISGVHWFGTEKVAVNSDGLLSAKQHTIRIPLSADVQGKQFVFPKEYQRLEDHSEYFTLDEGDIIIRGIATETGAQAKPSELQKKYDEVVTVVSITDNRAAPKAKHWRVVCK